ncbi:hypothetical protein P3X46_032765 [Hevea brasiliensis]|uniref:AB hydrolase-1 domain-containing protein n=2 Tax=Hevea brasiliensis TaxID=3981 RepID=A0ABQ9KFI5_HEVBR|nr:hypothetical protein P3X46_032765 [Hevea brasiliensis]
MIFLSLLILLLTMGKESLSTPPPQPLPALGKHFVLIHGAGHGAWSWYKLVPLLRLSGHNVTAIDLAASGIHLQQAKTLRSVSDYLRPLRDFLAALPPQERVILVGHSFGGVALSQAMERFPEKISVAVFLTALMPGPSFNISTLFKEFSSGQLPELDNHYAYDDGPNDPPTTEFFGPIFLKNVLYQLSPLEDWTLATYLVRPRRLFSYEDMSREILLTTDKYGSVRKVFIIAEEDLIIKKDFQQLMIQKNPPNEAQTVLGSDHMVMMSKPMDLCTILLQIADKYV